jgi:hypothetical protein
MSKAEERALEAYPKDIEEFVDVNGLKSVVDNNSWQRTIFLNGYHQAEKDLELTWRDIERIDDISIRLDGTEETKEMSNKEFYQEVLKRFKKK